nr:unnamed protein product [Spirometra erinaceieuropaei]
MIVQIDMAIDAGPVRVSGLEEVSGLFGIVEFGYLVGRFAAVSVSSPVEGSNTATAAYQALRLKFNRQGYRRVVRPETAVIEPGPSGNEDGHRQAPGTDETGGQPAANANPGDRLLGPNADRRQHSMRTPNSDKTPQPDVNPDMTTTVNTATGRCERDSETRSHDSNRTPRPDANSGVTTTVNTVTGRCERDSETRSPDSDRTTQADVNSGMTTTVHADTGRCERGRKARCVEGGQRTIQTRAMAAVTPAPPPSPHPTKDEEEPMPP